MHEMNNPNSSLIVWSEETHWEMYVTVSTLSIFKVNTVGNTFFNTLNNTENDILPA